MNAGILTIYGLSNYGNRLQNYAVTSALNKLGVEAETLVYAQWSKTPFRKKIDSEVEERLKTDPIGVTIERPIVVREIRYREFTEKHIPERHLDMVHYDEEIAKQYDFFVTGSDQVWNPTFRDSIGQLENRLLAFAKPHQRVCFAPSVGIDELDEKWRKVFHDELIKFPSLNVREESGADIIYELTGRKAEVVLDPTFMIDKKEWLSLSKPLAGFDDSQPYILYYFLGEEEHEIPAEMRKMLDELVQENNMKEVRILDPKDPIVRSAGPAEFLHLVNNASLICTDSFHGTVFSILMGKPFLLCNRKLVIADREVDMSNRTISLLNKLEMKEKLPENYVLDKNTVWDVDYTHAYEIIEKEKERMNSLLKTAMRLG